MLALVVVLVVLVVLAVAAVAVYNRLVQRRNRVDNAWSQIDVQLKRRHDLIPNLVEAVKDYLTYEQETLTKVTEARAAAIDAGRRGPAAQAAAENALSETLKSLFAVFENYPDLKANQNVMSLQEELTTTENRIAFARQFYNDTVLTYNNAIQVFPANLVANAFGFRPREYFAAAEGDRAVPAVDIH